MKAVAYAAVIVVSVAAACRGGEPDAVQHAVVAAFAKHAVQHKAVVDGSGHVIRLAVSNHGAFWKDTTKPAPEPMPEALFREVVKLPQLEAIAIEKQKLSDAGYALLGGLKKLRDVRLHYMDAGAGATKDAPLFINALPLPLEVLELKHNFSIKGGCMERLKPQPELKKLEIDTGYAAPDAVGFITNSAMLVNLQIHRTTMSDADLQVVFMALPNLEVLLVRPSGQKQMEKRITGRSLRGLKACSKLRVLVLGLEWGELPFEGGLDVFAAMPSVKQIHFAPSDITGFSAEAPAIQRLHEARPDILIRVGSTTLGGSEGQEWEQEDLDWIWDGGVTTHG